MKGKKHGRLVKGVKGVQSDVEKARK